MATSASRSHRLISTDSFSAKSRLTSRQRAISSFMPSTSRSTRSMKAAVGFFREHAQRQLDSRQRCPQVVRDAREQGGAVGQQLLDLFSHAVELARQRGELRRAGFRQGFESLALTDALGRGRQARQGRDQPVREPGRGDQGNQGADGQDQQQGKRGLHRDPAGGEADAHFGTGCRQVGPVPELAILGAAGEQRNGLAAARAQGGFKQAEIGQQAAEP
jgi:hypothetical protein